MNLGALEVELDAADLVELGALTDRHAVAGDRYPPKLLSLIDT